MRNLVALKVKANAHYTCQECGSTELIQAHHKIPGDGNSLIVLCAECHSKRHPGVPKALFFSTNNQPYWHNKSASSLAKELGVHSRTVIRAAKRLKILPGELSPWDEVLVRSNIPKLQQRVKKAKKARFPKTCARCNYSWNAFKPDPMYCPACGYWVHPLSTTPSPAEFIEIESIEGMVTPSNAAQQLNESETALYRRISANKIHSIKLGGIMFIPVSEIERLQNEKAAF